MASKLSQKRIMDKIEEQEEKDRHRKRKNAYTEKSESEDSDEDSDVDSSDESKNKKKKENWNCFRCSKCGKTFSIKGNLTTHERTTSCSGNRKKPFSCTYPDCSSSFASELHLLMHCNSHIKYRAYACGKRNCESKFYTMSQRNAHEKVCHKELFAKDPDYFRNRRKDGRAPKDPGVKDLRKVHNSLKSSRAAAAAEKEILSEDDEEMPEKVKSLNRSDSVQDDGSGGVQEINLNNNALITSVDAVQEGGSENAQETSLDNVVSTASKNIDVARKDGSDDATTAKLRQFVYYFLPPNFKCTKAEVSSMPKERLLEIDFADFRQTYEDGLKKLISKERQKAAELSANEKDLMRIELEAAHNEKLAAMQKVNESTQKETEALQSKMETMREQLEAVQKKQESVQEEKDTLQKEKETVLKEKEMAQNELRNLRKMCVEFMLNSVDGSTIDQTFESFLKGKK